MIPLIGFAPDKDKTTPGAVVECSNFIPYEAGMKGAPVGQDADVDALADECIGAASALLLDDSSRVFAGSADSLYELSGGAWTDVSKVGGYTGGADSRWLFAQFGNSTVAANGVDALQRSTTGDFADISGAPVAKIVFTVNAQVMLLNYDDGTDTPDGWHCSAAFDETDWTPSSATLCAAGRLVSAPGRLTAGARLGEYAIAYKEKAIFRGQFVGAPAVWDWQQIQGGEAGCVGSEALCDIGGAHVFVGQDNIWAFDGGVPVAIGTGVVRKWFLDNSNKTYLYRTKCVFDRANSLVWIFYPSRQSETCDEALVWHTGTKQWGRVTKSIEASMVYLSPGMTIDGLDAIAATIEDLSAYTIDSPLWGSGEAVFSVFDTTHQLQTITGASESSSFATWDVGSDDVVTLLSRVRLQFEPGNTPTTATISTFTKSYSGGAYSPRATGSINSGKFDILQSGKYHKASFAFTGDYKITGITATAVQDGEE